MSKKKNKKQYDNKMMTAETPAKSDTKKLVKYSVPGVGVIMAYSLEDLRNKLNNINK